MAKATTKDNNRYKSPVAVNNYYETNRKCTYGKRASEKRTNT